jgi:3-hydroxyisobutyrate dehydrogenase
MTKTIAVLGTGGMGAGMARRLLDSGFTVRVWNRTKEKLAPLVAAGARAADTPAQAAAGADVVLTSLAHADAVTSALFGPDGAVHSLPPGALILDASTTSVQAAQAAGATARSTGHHFLEARVLGNPQHARNGELRVLAGGRPEVLTEARPVLDALGKEVTLLGDWGAGAQMKIALNLFLGVQLAGLAEAVRIGAAAGLAPGAVLNTIGGSGYSAPVVAFRCGLLNADRLEPAAFRLDLMDKDLRLGTELAESAAVPAPVTEAAAALFRSAVLDGAGHLDAAAIVRPELTRTAVRA